MAVTWPLPANRVANDPDFIAGINQIEEALNQCMVGTGWRNIDSLMVAAVTGNMALMRVGRRVTLRFRTLTHATSGAGVYLLETPLPAQFRPKVNTDFRVNTEGNNRAQFTVWVDGRLQLSLQNPSIAAWQEISWNAAAVEFPTTPYPGVSAD